MVELERTRMVMAGEDEELLDSSRSFYVKQRFLGPDGFHATSRPGGYMENMLDFVYSM